MVDFCNIMCYNLIYKQKGGNIEFDKNKKSIFCIIDTVCCFSYGD